jgi:poly(beta-D-mannuronate) lyase
MPVQASVQHYGLRATLSIMMAVCACYSPPTEPPPSTPAVAGHSSQPPLAAATAGQPSQPPWAAATAGQVSQPPWAAAGTGSIATNIPDAGLPDAATAPAPPDAAAAAPQLPAQVLDLTNWKLTLPLDTAQRGSPDEYEQPELKTLVQAPYFDVDVATQAVVFLAPVGAPTTEHSKYPRAELREMQAGKEASWSNTSGRHELTITQAVIHLPAVKPHVVAGQIHDDKDDIVTVRLEEHHLFVERNGDELVTLESQYELGTVFTIRFVAFDGHIEVYYNGELKADIAKKFSGGYFKAGCYTQSNESRGDKPDAYGAVLIYDVAIKHE